MAAGVGAGGKEKQSRNLMSQSPPAAENGPPHFRHRDPARPSRTARPKAKFSHRPVRSMERTPTVTEDQLHAALDGVPENVRRLFWRRSPRDDGQQLPVFVFVPAKSHQTRNGGA